MITPQNFWLWFGGIWLSVGCLFLVIGISVGVHRIMVNDRLEKKGWTIESTWQRRFTTAIGVLLLAIGIFGVVFTLGLPPITAIAGAAMLYTCVMLVMGFWQA